MKTYDFIKQAIGKKVYITGDGDLMMSGGLREFITNKTPLTLVKLSRKGMAVLADDNGVIYSVRPSNVREINN